MKPSGFRIGRCSRRIGLRSRRTTSRRGRIGRCSSLIGVCSRRAASRRGRIGRCSNRIGVCSRRVMPCRATLRPRTAPKTASRGRTPARRASKGSRSESAVAECLPNLFRASWFRCRRYGSISLSPLFSSLLRADDFYSRHIITNREYFYPERRAKNPVFGFAIDSAKSVDFFYSSTTTFSITTSFAKTGGCCEPNHNEICAASILSA